MKMQLRFLKNCRDEKVIPSSCLPRRLRNFDNQAFSELDDILLTTYIKKLSGEVRTAFQKSNCARTLLRNCVSNEWWGILCDYIFTLLRRQNSTMERNFKVKLDKLFDESFWSIKSDPDLYVNFSTYELNKDEKLILGFGIGFCI